MISIGVTYANTNSEINLDSITKEHYIRKADEYHVERQYTLCIEYCNSVLKVDPTNHKALFLIAMCNAETNKLELSVNEFTHILELYPNDMHAYFNRSIIYYNLREFELAIKDLNVVIEKVPNDAEAYHFRAMAKEEINDKIGACADITEAHLLGHHESKHITHLLCSK